MDSDTINIDHYQQHKAYVRCFRCPPLNTFVRAEWHGRDGL